MKLLSNFFEVFKYVRTHNLFNAGVLAERHEYSKMSSFTGKINKKDNFSIF